MSLKRDEYPCMVVYAIEGVEEIEKGFHLQSFTLFSFIMTIHLLKPALRVQDIYAFGERQKQWHMEHEGDMVFPVWTSRKPAQLDDLMAGGSVYWIVKKAIQVRQEIVGFTKYADEEDEKPSYLILCDTKLIQTQPIEKRPFQGWRYLQPSNAPRDIGPLVSGEDAPPAAMARELRAAGLL